MKIKDIRNILEGFNAWHSTDKEFDKFEDGHFGIGSIYGEGLYFELTGADENYVEYVGKNNPNNRQQIKAYIDLDMDTEVIDAEKPLADQNLSLSLEEIHFLYKNNMIKDGVTSLIKFNFKVKSYDEVMNKIAPLSKVINHLRCEMGIQLKSIFDIKTTDFIEELLEADWIKDTTVKSLREEKKKEFFEKYDRGEIYSLFKDIKEKYYKMVLYFFNKKCKPSKLLNPVRRSEYPIMKKIWPQIKGIKFDASSSYATDEELKKVGGDSRGHSFHRIYFVLWYAKYAHITSKRNKITQKFHDEIEDEVLQDQLEYTQ